MKKHIAAISAEQGIVITQAQTTLLATPQRTAEALQSLLDGRAATEKRTGKTPPPLSRLQMVWHVRARGLWLWLVALPLAVTTLMVRTDLVALFHRLGADG